MSLGWQENIFIKIGSHYIRLIENTPQNVSDLYLDDDRDNILFSLNDNQIYNICLVANKGDNSVSLYIDGEKIVSYSDDIITTCALIRMPILNNSVTGPGCISLNTKQTDIVEEDIQEVIKMLELSCTV